MLIRRPHLRGIPSSEITPEGLYHNRREFLKTVAVGLAAAAVTTILPASALAAPAPEAARLRGKYDTDEKLTPYENVTTYNNYYEFGVDKEDPSNNAKNFKPRPWTVSVEGLVKKPAVYALDDLIKGFTMEDRIYRMRCVEAWSMVIPWLGFPLAALIKRLDPLPSAKFVEFKTLYDPNQMFEQKRPLLEWPYTEGLRMDETVNPLTLMAVGLYGKSLPNQNGAPFRLVVPWKYGFKGAKSVVKIRFTDKQPRTAWSVANPSEYGFYSNVNPEVDHPRWTQSRERRLGEFFPRKTLMFNGYGDYVASMYSGMDLKKYF